MAAGGVGVAAGGVGVAAGGVGVGTAPQPSAQASQQLDVAPTHAEPPLGALHFEASFLVEHLVWPLEFVRQHVTKPGLPQVVFAAHLMTAPLQLFGRELGSAGSSAARALATPAAQLT